MSFTQNLIVYHCSCKFSNFLSLIFSLVIFKDTISGFTKLRRILRILSNNILACSSWWESSTGVLCSQLPVLPLVEIIFLCLYWTAYVLLGARKLIDIYIEFMEEFHPSNLGVNSVHNGSWMFHTSEYHFHINFQK